METDHLEPCGAAREVPEAWIFESDMKEIPDLKVQPYFPQVEKFIFYRGAGNGYIPISAAIACETFLILNGLSFLVGEEEKYPMYLALAAGELTEDNFADWLRENTTTV